MAYQRTSVDLSAQNIILREENLGFYRKWLINQRSSEFFIYPHDSDQSKIYATITSGCYLRSLCSGFDPYHIRIFNNDNPVDINLVYHISRPLRCIKCPFKCCCFQENIIQDSNERQVGRILETCWYILPTFHSIDSDNTPEYIITPPVFSCCFRIIPNYCAESNCFNDSMYIFTMNSSPVKGNEVGKIVKPWSGWYNECCTRNVEIQITFPEDAEYESKVRLLGASMMMNELYFSERNRMLQPCDYFISCCICCVPCDGVISCAFGVLVDLIVDLRKICCCLCSSRRKQSLLVTESEPVPATLVNGDYEIMPRQQQIIRSI